MTRIIATVLGAGLLWGLASAAHAQGAASYPPASGHMYYSPPVYTAPGAVGSQYVETYRTYGGYNQPGVYGGQPVAPTTIQPAPVAPARVRGRQARRMRAYTQTYNQASPYSTPLPQGRLYWPGASMVPGYTPASRYQTYGSGYAVSPYGSNFYGGYWWGWPRNVPMIGD